MPMIPVTDGIALHCSVDDYLVPWQEASPVVMMRGFACNAAARTLRPALPLISVGR